MRTLSFSFVLAFAVVACQKTAATQPNEPATSASTPPATTSASASSNEVGKSCLMVNVCGCNLGCASVPLATSQLKPGTHTRVTKGALEGKDVQVVEVVDATGTRVLALSDRAENMPCSLAVEKAMGYACETSKSGPVPAKACANGCD